jgi:hypothetical protein
MWILFVVGGALVSSLSVTAQEAKKAEKPVEKNSAELISLHRLPAEALPSIEKMLQNKSVQVVMEKSEDGKTGSISVVAVREPSEAEVDVIMQAQKTEKDGTKKRCFGYEPGAVMREYQLPVSYPGSLREARGYCHNYVMYNGNRYTPRMGVGDVCNWKNLVQYYSDERYGNWDCCGYTYGRP